MLQGFVIRLLPTAEQEQLLWKSVDASRFAWNWGLDFQMKRFANGEKLLREYDLRDEFRKWSDNQEDMGWLKETAAKISYLSIYDLSTAYKNFFRVQKQGEKFTQQTIAKTKRKGRKLTTYDMKGHPKFKKKGFSRPAFAIPNDGTYFKKGCVIVSKVGKVKYQTELELPEGRGTETLYNPRIYWNGRVWVLAFAMEVPDMKVELNGFSLGVDVGIKELAVVSCADSSKVFKNINKTKRVRKLKKQLRHAQRNLSRKQKSSKHRAKSRKVVQKIYGRLSNIRHDYTHKVTTEIVDMLPEKMGLETLNIRGMMKNRHLSKAISEQSLCEFSRQLEYKAERRGIAIVRADPFFPSSKKCSSCGSVKKDLKLSDRVYECPACGLVINRDLNAAKNLEKLAS